LQVVRCEEDFARIAYVHLAPELASCVRQVQQFSWHW